MADVTDMIVGFLSRFPLLWEKDIKIEAIEGWSPEERMLP
jgi:hypothetical protein